MLEKTNKQEQFWNLHQIPHKTLNPDFRLIFFMRDDFRIKIKITFFSPEKT